jgi:hypothetical protein
LLQEKGVNLSKFGLSFARIVWRWAVSDTSTAVQSLQVTTQITAEHDFLEGVRAAVVDKDHNPQWLPARIEDVNAAAVEMLFDCPSDLRDDFKRE